LLWVATAAAAGLIVGFLVGSGLPPVLIAAAVLGPVVVVATVLNPSLGLLILVFTIFTHLSDVAVNVHGTPSVLQPYLLLLLAAVVAHTAWTGARPAGLGVPTLLLGAYGLVLSLSLFYATDLEAAQLAVSGYLRDAVICVVVVALLRNAVDLHRLVWVLVLAGGALAGLGVLQYVTGTFGNEWGGFAQASVKNIAAGTEDWRISGPIADPNHWAQALLVVVPLALGRMRRSKRRTARALGALCLGATVLAVIFTFSRGALLALAGTCLLAVYLRPPPKWAVLAAAVGVVLGLQLLPGGYTDRLMQLAQAVPGVGDSRPGEASLSGRLSALLAGQRMFADNPVVGVGAGQFTQHYRDYATGLGVDTVNGALEPHNLYLEVAAETGYLGVLTWGAVLGTALLRLLRARALLRRTGRRQDADLVEDVALSLLAYLLGGFFVHNAYPRLYWLLIGVALAAPAVARAVAGTTSLRSSAPARPPQLAVQRA